MVDIASAILVAISVSTAIHSANILTRARSVAGFAREVRRSSISEQRYSDFGT